MPLNLRSVAEDLLSSADLKINGSRPWDIQIKDERFFARALKEGSLGFGESYMDGWWECDQIDELICRILKADLPAKIKSDFKTALRFLVAVFLNPGSKSKAFEIGQRHYDIGNDLYQAMLDQRMVYSCGYWKNAANLDGAQEAKLDLICRKIGLKAGQKILDIGCGWGSLAKYAAQNYGAQVVGVTVSKKQVEMSRQICQGLPIEIRLQDYRELNEIFDHVISVGMFEHVGYKNYRNFMRVVHRCLNDQGLFLLHTIGGNRSVRSTDPWIGKYIFPNSMLPSSGQITKSIEGLFVMEDWHNFGSDYDKTLIAWYRNFHGHWPTLREKYGQRFYRVWRFYLLSCAGTFRSRRNQLWQVVMSKKGMPGGYKAIR